MKKFLKELGRNKAFRLRKCKPYILLFCALFALFELLGSTLAWYTTADSLVNVITTPAARHFRVRAVDVFDPEPEQGVYTKRVGAANVDDKAAFVRLLALPVFVIEHPDGPPTLLPATIGKPGSGAMVIMSDLNETDWIDATDLGPGGDGYFYYKYILEPGKSTDTGHASREDHNLFNQIEIGALPPGYEDAELVIEVICEAVSASPPGKYIQSWWGGEIPPDSIGNPLRAVYEALQAALAP